MSLIARQFAGPRGPLGWLIGQGMARRNAGLSRWVIQVAAAQREAPEKVAELGPGPGVGLQEALRRFGGARVWGIDPSPLMLAQSRKRNLAEVEAGRLTLVPGGVASLAPVAPVDIVVATHVLYFWHQPAAEMRAIRGALRDGGLLALGYQLRQNMPPMAQKHFPQQGHLLYGSDDEVSALLRSAGFAAVSHHVKGSPAAPEGRAALATA